MIWRIILGLWVHVGETADAHHEDELSLGIHEVVASGLGLAVHAHALLGQGTVLLGVLLGVLVGLDTLLLAGRLGCSSSGGGLIGELLLSFLLLHNILWHWGRRHG